ncbi:MAG: hypothetical protein Q7T71_19560, partial [Herbiconiux sp.]|nr:hypothetical protein [Herbiconiux sp.]
MRPFLPLLVLGIVLAAVSVATAAWSSLPETMFAQQQCYAAVGCADETGTTLTSAVLRAAPGLLVPGVAGVSLALALASRPFEGNRPVSSRPLLVLWLLGAVLTVAALVMIVVQAQPPSGSYGMSCDEDGCTASPGYSVNVFFSTVAPGLLVAGLLALVIAVAARAVTARAAHPVPFEPAEPEDGLATLLEDDDAESAAEAPAALGGLRQRPRREDLSVYMRPADHE